MNPTTAISKPLSPPLKWAGGKRWLLPHLRPIWEAHSQRRLVEPFCGGLAVALGLRPQQALLNDINPHAINFYSWLQRGLKATIDMRNDKTLFYEHREEFNRLITNGKRSGKKAAEIFYYLNRTGYNGLCRFNRSGEFNVPFGSYKAINYVRDFSAYKEILSKWKFTKLDFEELEIDRDDFIYADPPYDMVFRQYVRESFEWHDQVRLAKWLANHRGPVVVSNHATRQIVRLYRSLGFKIEFFYGPRMISCNGNRSRAKEILAQI